MPKTLNPNRRYVVGFIFSQDRQNVLLIRKARPEWQRGKLNGIGGEIEKGETPYAAMTRECAEECGLVIRDTDWNLFCSIRDSRGWWIDFFFAEHPAIGDAESLTGETVVHIPIANLNEGSWFYCIPNLRWLIPMALSMRDETCKGFEIQERVR